MHTHATVSWAAASKWAVRDSGDAVLVHALHGDRILGVIVDVQGTGSGAGKTAWSLAALGSELASEGADAASTAAMLNRALWSRRGGRVQAGVGVLLWDPAHGATTATYGSVLTAPTPADALGSPPQARAAGLDPEALPATVDRQLFAGTLALCSDGVATTCEELAAMVELVGTPPSPADVILATAVARDQGRPRNDMSIIALRVSQVDLLHPATGGELRIVRRASAAVREATDGR